MKKCGRKGGEMKGVSELVSGGEEGGKKEGK